MPLLKELNDTPFHQTCSPFSSSVPDGGDASDGEAGALLGEAEHAGDADELRGDVAGEEEGEGGHAREKEGGPRAEGGGEVVDNVVSQEEEEWEWEAVLEIIIQLIYLCL